MPNETENQLATKKVPLPVGNKGIELNSFEALWRFALCIAASPFAPRGLEKPEAIVTAIQLGLEIGLSPMSALQNVAVINGRPGIYGDAALALVRASGRCEFYTQSLDFEGDERVATVTSKRDDSPEPIVSTFSVRDAKRAGLWGKQGPWSQYPDRMLLFRARGFNLRDNFGDILKGMHTLEELRDINEKPIEGKVVAPDIRFDEPVTVTEGVHEVDGAFQQNSVSEAIENTEKERVKRKRRTKAEMEAERALAQQENTPVPEVGFTSASNPEYDTKPPSPPLATPLEGLRNLINASPITEFQFEQQCIKRGFIQPTRTLDSSSDQELIRMQESFMTIAEEIINPKEVKPF